MKDELQELKKTDVYTLYEKGKRYLYSKHVYSDTDLNYRMYEGDQWAGAIIDGIEKAQYNFIETIVNYKVSNINQNIYAMHFSSENFEQKEFRQTAEKVCELLDKKAAKDWEADQMDAKIREVSTDAAVNDEGIIYSYYDEEEQQHKDEVLDKNDVQYANEQSSDIQNQPYIIIVQRKPVLEVQEFAKREGLSDEKLLNIVGDNQTGESAGDEAKIEKDDMVDLITKLWKENGTVWQAVSTKFVDIVEPSDTGRKLYPIAHMLWKPKKGWSRGEGEVRGLIPNQLELNKSLARMLLSVKQCAYPQKVANIDKIVNPSALNKVGGIIKTKGATVDDVSKIFTYIQPTSMSTDVNKLMNDLIGITRDLKNASDIATGSINPEAASGKAILAVQQASQQPLTQQTSQLTRFIEDLARIWLDSWISYSQDGMRLEEEVLDGMTGETRTELVDIPSTVFENLKGTVKIDITPTSPYDRYARELTLENFLKAGFFSAQRIGELRVYAEALPDYSSAPKQKLLEICDKVEQEQQRIAEMNAQAEMMKQRAQQFLDGDVEQQAAQINEAELQQYEEGMEEQQ